MTKLFLQIVVITLLVFTTVWAATSGSQTSTPATGTQRHQHHPHRQNHHQNQHHHHHPHTQQQQLHLPDIRKSQKPQNQRQHRRLYNDERNQRLSRTHLNDEVEYIDNSPRTAAQQKNATTRLRRISARDYYNKVVQRRLPATRNGGGHSDFGYNTYNIHTNTYGPPPPSVGILSGKGDDNTHDVEFIGSSSSTNPEWSAPNPRRGYGYVPPLVPSTTIAPTRRVMVTAAPPPALVPARRGYAAAAPASGSDTPTQTTEDPFETNTIGRSYPSDPNEMERRHICVQQRTITMPVKTTEVYTRPIWKHVSAPCQPQTQTNQMCTRVQIVHEQAFRDVIRHKSAQQVTYDCCTGWTRESPLQDSCMKPVCATRCQNGGTCSGPDTCSCSAGFTGHYCEHDINECKEEKPCDQICLNTVGSYYCKCREGFVLQGDQQSCKKIDLHDDDAFEARDLENEIESSDDVTTRLQKIERSLANERVQTNELQKSLQATYNVVDTLKSRLSTLEKQQQDFNRIQTNLYATETRTNKLEGMVNLLMKCRNGPNAYCP